MSTEIDVALIGGGIMSATLGTLLNQLRPDWSIVLFERLDRLGKESSDGWNNAGTGHAALCELNYTPRRADGSIDLTRAIKVSEQFHVSRQFWSYLVEQGILPSPRTFIRSVPHMSFVRGDKDIEFLERRYDAMVRHPLFAGMELSRDTTEIAKWIPLVTDGRDPSAKIAVTRSDEGTDVDFGSMTRFLFSNLQNRGVDLLTHHSVRGLRKLESGRWSLSIDDRTSGSRKTLLSRFVFVGAGGQAISLLNGSGIPEIKGYGGFPVSGQFLRCVNPELVGIHRAKVYGKPNQGAPPILAPHLDTRMIDGKPGLLFGPYASFTPRLLKFGSSLDFIRSIRRDNILTMLAVARNEIPLTKYLIGQALQSSAKRIDALRDFVPLVKDVDWELHSAGQRVQVMKRGKTKRGVLEFGTELVCAGDGSIAGLLGASPGASTAVPIMIDLIERCFPGEIQGWRSKLREMIPSYGVSLSDEPALLDEVIARTDRALELPGGGVELKGTS